jgi:hypothetical protein
MSQMDDTPFDAQRAVIEWAWYGESYSKIGFLKRFCQTLGKEEIHHVKNILSNILKQDENRIRKWVGPNPTLEFKRRKLESEDPTFGHNPSSSLPRSFVSRYEEAEAKEPCGSALAEDECRSEKLKPWWKKSLRADVVGYDAEHVHLKNVTGTERIRGGKVAVVDSSYKTLYKADIYHAPGTFLCNKEIVRISGINRDSLIHGTPMKEVRARME